MAEPKKGLAAMIIGKAKPAQPVAPEMSEEFSPKQAAAEEIMEAIEAKDASALAEALKAFMDVCSDEEMPMPEESEMMEE